MPDAIPPPMPPGVPPATPQPAQQQPQGGYPPPYQPRYQTNPGDYPQNNVGLIAMVFKWFTTLDKPTAFLLLILCANVYGLVLVTKGVPLAIDQIKKGYETQLTAFTKETSEQRAEHAKDREALKGELTAVRTAHQSLVDALLKMRGVDKAAAAMTLPPGSVHVAGEH